jgi:hypothetical protein
VVDPASSGPARIDAQDRYAAITTDGMDDQAFAALEQRWRAGYAD